MCTSETETLVIVNWGLFVHVIVYIYIYIYVYWPSAWLRIAIYMLLTGPNEFVMNTLSQNVKEGLPYWSCFMQMI